MTDRNTQDTFKKNKSLHWIGFVILITVFSFYLNIYVFTDKKIENNLINSPGYKLGVMHTNKDFVLPLKKENRKLKNRLDSLEKNNILTIISKERKKYKSISSEEINLILNQIYNEEKTLN